MIWSPEVSRLTALYLTVEAGRAGACYDVITQGSYTVYDYRGAHD
jgi:hypothetical protein